MNAPIIASPLASRLERSIRLRPLRAARHLADLDDLLRRKPELDYERNLRDGLVAAFERLGRCSHCGRELRNPKSVDRGTGATCQKRIAEAARRRAARNPSDEETGSQPEVPPSSSEPSPAGDAMASAPSAPGRSRSGDGGDVGKNGSPVVGDGS